MYQAVGLWNEFDLLGGTIMTNDTRMKILQFIEDYTRQHHYCPSVREITKAVGLKSPSTTHGHIQRMKRDGLLASQRFHPRTVQSQRQDTYYVLIRTNIKLRKRPARKSESN